jgi:16S rRNA (guanine527-N7)-methyltransferase
VTAEVEERLERLAQLIAGSPHNLVGPRDREVVRPRHIDEALAIARVFTFRSGQRWLDLGTGGGLPGLALALTHPEVQWVLLDATRKKVEEVDRFIAELGLQNATTRWGRAEDLARRDGERGVYDGIVSRAVGPLPIVMELSRGFLREGGYLVAIKGPAVAEEMRAARAAAKPLHFQAITSRPVPDPERSTVLVTMRAHGAPPARFPRRVGEPAATPLGG